MRIDWGAALFGGLLSGAICAVWLACSHQYTPPQVPNADDLRVWGQLVDAGCVDPKDDGGPVSLDQSHARTDQPSWLACMYADGSVTSCAAPCH